MTENQSFLLQAKSSPREAAFQHKEIRNYIQSLYDNETADAVRIQYGGSVKSENALEILGEPNIDGALVGGASLVVDEFIDIIKAANQVSA